jgi:antitoxin component YwqK of YwqJK toxin-antitoxin module
MVKYIILFITSILAFQIANAQGKINPDGYNVFYYPNGQKSSEGNFKNGKPEGYWKNYYETGVLKSEGNRKMHQLDSTWLFYYDNGLLKEKVAYKHSIKEGFSFRYSEEGFLLEKLPYKNDTIQGVSFSYFIDLNRVEFEKPFKDGVLSGRGYQFGRDGRIIGIITYEKGVLKSFQAINKLNSKNKKVGLWIAYYEDITNRKAKYLEGRYKDGLKNGYFREYDKKGVQISTTKYVNGQVVENAAELMSVDLVREYYPNATVKWEKTYLGAKPHGIWKEYDTAGVVINTIVYRMGVITGEGIIDHKGIKQGHWKEYYLDGTLRGEGDYKDGARVGSWKFFHGNAKLEQYGKYRAGGKPHGLWIWYYDDGSVRREENYINGKEDGEMTEYTPDGEIIEQGEYIEGLKEGSWVVNTGDYIEKGEYIEGMMHGMWEGIYKSTGKTAFKGEYLEDEPNGKHTHYYPSGRKMVEGKYQLGLKVGDWKRYDENGVLKLTIKYKNGVAQRLSGKKVIGNPEE